MAFYYSKITTYLQSTSHLDVVRRVTKSGIIKERTEKTNLKLMERMKVFIF
jgi:hypothetical protein